MRGLVNVRHKLLHIAYLVVCTPMTARFVSISVFVLGRLSVLVLAVQLTGLLVCACFNVCIPGKQIND